MTTTKARSRSRSPITTSAARSPFILGARPLDESCTRRMHPGRCSSWGRGTRRCRRSPSRGIALAPGTSTSRRSRRTSPRGLRSTCGRRYRSPSTVWVGRFSSASGVRVWRFVGHGRIQARRCVSRSMSGRQVTRSRATWGNCWCSATTVRRIRTSSTSNGALHNSGLETVAEVSHASDFTLE